MEKAPSVITKKYPVAQLAAWTVIVLLSLVWNAYEGRKDTLSKALNEARTYHALTHSYREWASGLGGVYAPAEKISPNLYLIVPDREKKALLSFEKGLKEESE